MLQMQTGKSERVKEIGWFSHKKILNNVNMALLVY